MPRKDLNNYSGNLEKLTYYKTIECSFRGGFRIFFLSFLFQLGLLRHSSIIGIPNLVIANLKLEHLGLTFKSGLLTSVCLAPYALTIPLAVKCIYTFSKNFQVERFF